jgi:hypothetical protein
MGVSQDCRIRTDPDKAKIRTKIDAESALTSKERSVPELAKSVPEGSERHP